MGRQFLENFGGRRIFSCARCHTYLTNIENFLSDSFRGSTGKALLFGAVTNVDMSEIELKNMLTGDHYVRDVNCKRCKARLGWMYEMALNHTQVYKEGRVILEQRLIVESLGIIDKEIPETPRLYASPSSASTSSSSLSTPPDSGL